MKFFDRFDKWLWDRIMPTPCDWLAEREAANDAWEPDELWFAQQTSAGSPAGGDAPTQEPPVLTLVPGGAAPRQAGGATHFDELIEALVSDYRDFIHACFEKHPPK